MRGKGSRGKYSRRGALGAGTGRGFLFAVGLFVCGSKDGFSVLSARVGSPHIGGLADMVMAVARVRHARIVVWACLDCASW